MDDFQIVDKLITKQVIVEYDELLQIISDLHNRARNIAQQVESMQSDIEKVATLAENEEIFEIVSKYLKISGNQLN